MASILDPLGVTALVLGLIAMGIAVWDHVRDRYYYRRHSGPVDARISSFDIPQPGLRSHTVLLPNGEGTRTLTGVAIRVVWEFWNHVSWPIYVSFPVESRPETDGPSPVIWVYATDDFYQTTGSSVMVPPRQPFKRSLWVIWSRETDGEVTPLLVLGSERWGGWQRVTRHVRWREGTPSLSER